LSHEASNNGVNPTAGVGRALTSYVPSPAAGYTERYVDKGGIMLDRVKQAAVVATPLSIAASVLYLIGYWGSFKIPVFQYISFQDIVTYSMYPLIGTALWVVAAAAYQYVEVWKSTAIELTDWLSRILWMFQASLALLFTYVPMSLLGIRPFFAFLSVCLFLILERTTLLRAELGDQRLRTALIYSMVVFPIGAYALGQTHARTIIRNEEYALVQGVAIPGAESGTNIKLLGKAGEYFVFSSMDNTYTYVTRIEAGTVLVLHWIRPRPAH
jgi:hypothetical protein